MIDNSDRCDRNDARQMHLKIRLSLMNAFALIYYPLAVVIFFTLLSHLKDLHWAAFLVIITALFVGKPFLHSCRETVQLHQNYFRAWQDDRSYFLLLRSFSKTDLQNQTQRAGRTVDTFSFIEYIEDAVAPLGGVVLLGGSLSYLRIFGGKAPKAILLHCDDMDWMKVIVALARESRAIILIPQTSRGVLQELEFLQEAGLLGKTIVTMPPEHEFQNSRFVWSSISKELEGTNFSLPAYRESGCAYIPLPNLMPKHSIDLSSTWPWREAQMKQSVFSELLKFIPNEGLPLKKSLSLARKYSTSLDFIRAPERRAET